MDERSIVVFLVYPIVAWIIGHQSSHIAAAKSGKADLSGAVAVVMGLEIFAGFLFLIWYGYQTRWSFTVALFGFSLLLQLPLIVIERAIGLTKRAWVISTGGVIVVPAALIGLVYLTPS